MAENSKECGNCGDGTAIAYCNDCREFICDNCQDGHKTFKALKTHCITSISQDQENPTNPTNSKCPIHPKQAITKFCEHCNQLICTECATDHQNHKSATIQEVFCKNRSEIVTALKPLKVSVSKAEKKLKSIERRPEEITKRSTMLEAEIKGKIEQLKGLLDRLKDERIGELEKLTYEKLKTLNEQKMRAESIQKDLSSCEQEVETKLQNMKDVVQVKDITIDDIKRIMDKHEEEALQPELGWNIELGLDETENFEQVCQQLFEITETDVICTETSHMQVSEGGLEGATIGKMSTVVFKAQTKQKSGYVGHLDIRADLVHVKSKKTHKCSVAKQQYGCQYSISYRPMKRGKHELQVTVNRDHVKGSPFQVVVPFSPQSFGRPTRVINLIDSNGLTVDNGGRMVVIESNGECVSVLTTEGDKGQGFGTAGSGNGQLNGAYGVTVDKDDNIYIADCGNNRIQKFDSKGVFKKKVGTSGSGSLQFSKPSDVCFNREDNNLYVVDSNNHRIQVLSTELLHVRSFGAQGKGSEQLKNPRCIDFDSANNLYVSDQSNNCVKVFTVEGKFLRSFSQKSNSDKLKYPYGIAIDSNDIVYVSETGPNLYGPHYVSVFKSEGAYITTFGGNGSEQANFKYVYGMAVDHNDSLVVADKGNNRLQIF